MKQGVPGIIASLALTKTLAVICDIRKGRLSDVPAHLKLLIKLLQSGCLGTDRSIFDLPEFIVSNVSISRCQTRSFQCAGAGRQLRTLGDDSDITHKFH